MAHIWVGNPTITSSNNGLSPGRRQAIIWTNAGVLLIGPSGTKLSALELLQSFAKPWYRYLQHPPRCSTADMRRPNSAIIIVADVLAPDSHQVINNNHAESVVTTGSHGSSVHGMQHSCHTTPIKQTTYMIKGGHGVNKLGFLVTGWFIFSRRYRSMVPYKNTRRRKCLSQSKWRVQIGAKPSATTTAIQRNHNESILERVQLFGEWRTS